MLEDYADWEGAYLSTRIHKNNDWTVKTASLERTTCTSIGGFKTVIDYSLEEIPLNIDLFVLIGGDSWGKEYRDVSEQIAIYLEKGIMVGAICGAVDFLARNGHLNDYKHTANSLDLLKQFSHYDNEENFFREQAVADRNLVTANGLASIEFSEKVLKALEFKDPELIEITNTSSLFVYYTISFGYRQLTFISHLLIGLSPFTFNNGHPLYGINARP